MYSIKHSITPVLLLCICLFVLSCRKTETQSRYDLVTFPEGFSPQEIGDKLSNRFIESEHMLHDGKWIHYAEVCTWYGALRYAEAAKDTTLIKKLEERFLPLFSSEKELLPIMNHVDLNMFGCLPLEFYRINGNEIFYNVGMPYADTQWQLPANATPQEKEYAQKDLSWQTRLWIDDMFMITIIQSKAYQVTGNREYIDRAAREMVIYLDELQRPNGLFYHAPDVPFYWARGNGWMAAGMTELLRYLPHDNTDRPRILEGYHTMMKSLKGYQDETGMWKQLVDEPSFWPETSGSAMFAYAMITGVKHGWLNEEEYLPVARKAWMALVPFINNEGDVTEVCIGTNKLNDKQYYYDRPRITGDFHGQAPYLWCVYALMEHVTPDYTQYVRPFIGNADNGHTFPGACAPFGLIQASPESGIGSWRYCSGFNYDDDKIEGFAQTHLNGTGVPDLGDLLMFPFCGSFPSHIYKSRYDRDTQHAAAGYYKVSLTDAHVDVELTATSRTAFHKYTFKEPGGRIFLDLQRGLVGSVDQIKDHVLNADIDMPDNYTITGHNEVQAWVQRHYYYVIKFDKPYSATMLPQKDGEKARRMVLSFNTKPGESVQVKVSMSTVSREGALASLEKENPGWNFNVIKGDTKAAWNELLSRVRIKGTDAEKINFYTSMYHLFIQPNNIADTDGRYRGADDKVYTSPTGEYYSTLSLWDTYRAAHPLYTILSPEKVDGFVQTMLAHHKAQGFLPIWTLWGKENYCMIGNHSIPVIVDAYLKGFKGFDAGEAYRAIKESSTISHKNSDWATYEKYGYYPFDIIHVESVSRTLESAYDDYCVAQMAKAMGETEDYRYFMNRSEFYKNLFDPETKLMRGKDSQGHWRTPFSSFALSHADTHGGDYTEGNAWQYTWHVQHDPQSLIELMGGKGNFVNKLDSLFFLETKEGGEGFVSDVTGLIGQYAHGNEPSHHVAYLYNYADRKDKTQELIREVFDRFYLPKPDGLCGNDDCGQMSAWYIFSAMGFYPVNPIGGEYVLGAPQIEKVSLLLPGNKTFTVEAKGLSRENKYVKSVELNGKPVNGLTINHKDIMKGGVLVFTMTNRL